LHRSHRSELRSVEDPRRRSFPVQLDDLREIITKKVTAVLSSSDERPRSATRNDSYNSNHSANSGARRNRDHVQSSSGLSRSRSELSSEDSEVESSGAERRRRRRHREQERERIRNHDQDLARDRERDQERERKRERGRDQPRDRVRERDDDKRFKYLARPEAQRRTSSHADVDRRRDKQPWNGREDERMRGERKQWDTAPSPLTGVGGRRYPPEPGWD
jgi:hypothetical protein